MARSKDPAERAARLAQYERQERTRKMGRYAIITVVTILVIAGAAYGISKIPKQPGLVHWHAKWEVYVNDQPINWDAYADVSRANGGQLYLPAHLHQPTDIIHNEGREGEGTIGKLFLYHLGGKLTNTEILIPPEAIGATGDYRVNDTNKLQLFVSHSKNGTADWAQQSDIAGYSFHDGDRILLLYGNYTPQRIADLEAQFPSFDPQKVA